MHNLPQRGEYFQSIFQLKVDQIQMHEVIRLEQLRFLLLIYFAYISIAFLQS